MYPDQTDDHLEDLARHFSEGGDPEKGADYAYRAGLKNDRLFNWSWAAALYWTALSLWEELGGHVEQRAAVNEKLGDVSFRSGLEAPRAIKYLRQALDLYEQSGNQRKLAVIHSQMAREYFGGANPRLFDSDLALAHLHQARAILESEPPSVSLGWVENTLSTLLWSRLEWCDCLECAERSLEIGKRFAHRALIAHAYLARGGARVNVGDVAAGFTDLEAAWQLAAEGLVAWAGDGTRWFGSWNSALLKNPRGVVDWGTRRPDFQSGRSRFA